MAISSLIATDTHVSLIINRLTKQIYNELCATPGEMDKHRNELFLVEDDDFDVYNKRVINVKQPISAYDAVNLGFIEEQYAQKNQINEILDRSNVYFNHVEKDLSCGSKYIDNQGNIYRKNTDTSRIYDYKEWNIVQISGTYELSDLSVKWFSGFGWGFTNDGTTRMGRETKQDTDVLVFNEGGVYLSGNPWQMIDNVAKKSEIISPEGFVSKQDIKAKLSVINSSSTFQDIVNAISSLCDL